MILRLLRLRENEAANLPPAEWEEFLSMKFNEPSSVPAADTSLWRFGQIAGDQISGALQALLPTRLITRLEIETLICACTANHIELRIPLIKTIGMHEDCLGDPIVGGVVLSCKSIIRWYKGITNADPHSSDQSRLSAQCSRVQ